MSELLVGCGSVRDKRLFPAEGVVGGQVGRTSPSFKDLVTLDVNPTFEPDYVHDLTQFPYPFKDDTFEEVHAYEVLEHIGTQGDFELFFAQFSEFYRILKPGGFFCATVPWWNGRWAWADPGHTRVITPDTLAFLDQSIYEDENAMLTDYRDIWKGNFVRVYGEKRRMGPEDDSGDKEFGAPEHFLFVLKAVKR